MSDSSASDSSTSVVNSGSDGFGVGICGSSRQRLVSPFCIGPNFLTARAWAFCLLLNVFPIELSAIFAAVRVWTYSFPLWGFNYFMQTNRDSWSLSIISPARRPIYFRWGLLSSFRWIIKRLICRRHFAFSFSYPCSLCGHAFAFFFPNFIR